MKFRISKPLWLVPFVLLALLGAGCLPSSEPTPAIPASPSAPSSNPTPAPTPTPTPAPSPTPSEDGEVTTPSRPPYDLPEIDETWETYTNRAETFSFRWPTKGRLAPTWSVDYATELQDGCYVSADAGSERGPRTNLLIGDLTFCHKPYMDAGAGQRHLTDYYATTLNGLNIVIGFEKTLANGDMIGDGECAGKLVLPGATATNCQEVDPAAYAAHLDQIVRTFSVLP